MKPDRLKTLCALAAGALVALSAAATAQIAQAQSGVVVALPLGAVASPAHRIQRNAFAPRVYVAVPHRPARFLVGNAVEDFEESYDDTDDEFDLADTDNDGFISFREARRANPDWARHFNRIDASGDGFLTREEIETFFTRERVSK